MTFPKSGPCFSPVTLGTVQLGLPYGVANQSGQPGAEASKQILDAAVEGGITSFDTAPSYGSSEEVLGQYFAGKPKPFIVSKWSLHESGDGFGPTAGDLRKQIEDTLKGRAERLGCTCIPAMLLHTPMILKRYGAEVTGLLRDCVQEGKVGKVGVSLGVHVDREFQELWPVIEDDLYEIVQLPLNVLDQRLIQIGALEKLKQAGKQVLARSVYLQGLIFLDESTLPDHLKSAAPWLEKLRQLAKNEGMSVTEFAFSYVRDTSGVSSVLIGAETAGQVRENLALLNVKPLSNETREQIKAEFTDIPELLITPALWNLWK